MPVHPRELLLVEHPGARHNGVQGEPARQLADRHQLGIGPCLAARGPADEREVVHQGLGEVPLRSEFGHCRRAVPFRQRRVVGPHHERQMREGRRREPECLVEQELPRRIRNVILASKHVRDRHQRIVDDDREVVRGRAAGSHDHGIADDIGLESHLAADGIGEDHLAMLGHEKPDRGPLARSDPLLGVRAHDLPAPARVPYGPEGGHVRGTVGLELRWRAEAAVRLAGAQELLGVRLVQVQPLGLAIRPARTADVWSLVPVEAEPPQVAENRGLGLDRRPLDVGVLDPKDERRVRASREQPVEQGGARVADVELASRAGCKSQSHETLRRRDTRNSA